MTDIPSLWLLTVIYLTPPPATYHFETLEAANEVMDEIFKSMVATSKKSGNERLRYKPVSFRCLSGTCVVDPGCITHMNIINVGDDAAFGDDLNSYGREVQKRRDQMGPVGIKGSGQ